MKPRIIVCGLGRTGYKVFRLLRQQGAQVVGIHHRHIPGETRGDVIIGNLHTASTLKAAGIEQANTLVIAGPDDAVNLAVTMQARVLNPNIRIINRFFNSSLGDRLDRALPEHLSMSVAGLAAPVFSFAAMGNKAIGQIKLFEQTWPIHEINIDAEHPWVGCKLQDLWENRARLFIYYLPHEGYLDLVSAVLTGVRLKAGDRLIMATKPKIRSQRKFLLRKFFKILTNIRQFREHARAVVIGAFIILMIIFVATLTYMSAELKLSIIDALYFSVGLLTGAGGNEKVIEQAPESVKYFTVVIMLIGAIAIGIWYALLNDFVLGSRFKQFLDVARVPQRHHFIVCGLSGTGIKIVQHLNESGYDVVVIEPDTNNRFINTARGLGIPVIVGDASFPSTLAIAHLGSAVSVLAVSGNDASNLEIALNTRAIAPDVPIIVRYADPDFARIAQQVFDFDAVLSPAELAAPAFAAAALGGRVLGNGITSDSLWVAIATSITASHPFCHQTVQDAAMNSNFVPLYVETENNTIHGWDLLRFSLCPGDVLYLTMPATRLHALWRYRTPHPMAS